MIARTAYTIVIDLSWQASVCFANLIVDGSFENPPLGAPGFLTITSGNSVGAWQVGSDAGFGIGENVTLEHFPALPASFPWLTAHSGLQYLDLTGVANQPGSFIE